MKNKTCLVALLLATLTGAAGAADMTLERIVSDPPLAGAVPRQVEISKGGGWVSELRPSSADSRELELWARPIQGGAARRLASAAELLAGHAESLSEAEKMALERKRITQRGITSYQWCGAGDDKLLFPLSGDLYLVRLGQPAVRITDDPDVPEQDPVCSPDGKQVAYVKGGNLWVQSLEGGKPRALSRDGGQNAITWGLAEFIAAEELSRENGYWWSPDGKSILALRVDESVVPLKTRAQIFADRIEQYQQRYPSAGSNNAKVTAWRIDLASAAAQPLPLPPAAEYISRAGWFADGTPWLQWLTRDQKRMVLTEFALKAPPHEVVDEHDAAWVEVHSDLAELKGLTLSGKPALLWSSEASGRRQLVTVDRVTGARKPLTDEPEPVAHLICTDGQQVVYSAARDRGRSRGLFSIDLQGHAQALAGGKPREWRDAVSDKACRQLLITRSAWSEPPRLSVQAVGGSTAVDLPGVAADPLVAQTAPVPQPLDVTAADGKTTLNGFYFAPLDGKPGKHAVITLAYGGPGTSTVRWAWYRDTPLIAHWQRAGYGVFMIDTRGMAERDRAYTRAHANAFGQVEVNDLFAAVRQLPQLVGDVDPARIGFFGWSYGGFLAARSMLDANTPLAAAVAVAPPTDWTLYDTAYTERYLGIPEGGKAASYANSNLLTRAPLLSKPLLIVHGTADDNVLFEHSLRLVQALQDQGKLFDLDIFPGKAHGLNGTPNARLHLWRTLDAFFAKNLKP